MDKNIKGPGHREAAEVSSISESDPNEKSKMGYFADHLIYTDRKTQLKRIIELFNRQEFVKTIELRLIASQYNARIYDLRKMGYLIRSEKQDNFFGYVLYGYDLRKMFGGEKYGNGTIWKT